MKINIKQEGGFIGMASKAKLDFDKLTEDEQKMLDSIAQKAAGEMVEKEKVVEKSEEKADGKSRDTSSQADSVPPPPSMSPARDTFSYSLSMKKDGKKLDVAFDDTNAPPELVALFQKYIQI
jgi:hypothetical protein